MNWAQFKEVVASWSLTWEVAGSSPFTVMTNIFVTEFRKFSETFRKNSNNLLTRIWTFWWLLKFQNYKLISKFSGRNYGMKLRKWDCRAVSMTGHMCILVWPEINFNPYFYCCVASTERHFKHVSVTVRLTLLLRGESQRYLGHVESVIYFDQIPRKQNRYGSVYVFCTLCSFQGKELYKSELPKAESGFPWSRRVGSAELIFKLFSEFPPLQKLRSIPDYCIVNRAKNKEVDKTPH